MADKNFARSGSADTDFLADDDPLSELAHLVGYEPRPVQPVARPAVEPVQPVQRHENPVLALEDELLRAFEQYDAPRRRAAVEERVEPVLEREPPPAEPQVIEEPEPDVDPGLMLADEVESAVEDLPAVEVEAEPVQHAGHVFAERLEPSFEEAAPPVVEAFVPEEEPEPVFLGLQPVAESMPDADAGIDLERELELSIGDGFAEEMLVDPGGPAASLLGDLPQDAEPFTAAEPAYAEAEPQFQSDLFHEAPDEHARVMAEAEAQWQAEAGIEPAFHAEPAYEVEAVAKGDDYDHDALLAEVERFPVPETRSPFTAVTLSRATPTLGRATPVAQRETVEQPAEPVFEEPIAAAPEPEPEPEIEFENFEIDFSDIELELDPAELALEELREMAKPADEAKPAPSVAVPVTAYTAPQVPEPADIVLPFDPTMIAETDEGVAPVTELDVPQLPAVEKEKPPVPQTDYDFDIDAEMAQLFAASDMKPAEDADVASVARQAARIAEVDDFERALEEDFRRSLNQSERMAIPVDPGQADGNYAGDGYDEGRPTARRGMLLAASVAAVALLVGGGVYAWMSLDGGIAGSGEPRVILADKEPVKVVPEEKGGKTVPNQDKAVYDRVAGDTNASPQQDRLVTTTEEPVDVVQRTLTPETLPFDGLEEDDTPATAEDDNRLLPGVDEPATAEADDGRSLVSPRKVKTMIVKPDGTLVTREETVGAPETDLAAAATATTGGAASGEAVATIDEAANLPAEADASLRTEQAEAEPRSALAEVADAEVEDTAPVRVVRTTAVTKTDGNAPVPGTRPVDQPVNVVGTVTENGNVRGDAEATTTGTTTQTQQQVAAVAPGSYVVQIASLPSEAEAQKSYNTLSAKFASVIGGRGVDIKKAEIPNKGTYYRVRIPAGSREEANSLCSRYKSAGGSCLVTR